MRLRVLLLPLLLAFSIGWGQAETFEELAARATAARNANDSAQAISLYQQGVAMKPTWQEGWWFLGTFLYEREQYPGARDAFRRFVGLAPNAGPAWGLLGLCEFQTGEFAASLEHVQRSLSLGTGKEKQIGGVLFYHEALLLTRTGNFDQALQKYGAFVRSGVTNAPLLTGLGLAALRRSQTPKEIAADQQDLVLLAGKATYFTMAADAANAELAFREMLARFGTVENVHYIYACYLATSDPDRAAEELRRELAISRDNPAASSMFAWSLLTKGDAPGALPYAEKAVQGDPNSASSRYVLGRALVENGKVERGIGYLEQSVQMDPDNLEHRVALATAYPKAGRYQDAKQARQKALALSQEMASSAAR